MKRRTCEHGVSRKIFCNACIDDFCAGYHIMPQEGGGIDMEEKRDRPMTDHAEAAAECLGAIIRRLEGGVPPEDLGADVILIGRMMARRI
jgi:hypothetical protein